MLKIKLRALLANAWSPHVIIPLNFQMSKNVYQYLQVRVLCHPISQNKYLKSEIIHEFCHYDTGNQGSSVLKFNILILLSL